MDIGNWAYVDMGICDLCVLERDDWTTKEPTISIGEYEALTFCFPCAEKFIQALRDLMETPASGVTERVTAAEAQLRELTVSNQNSEQALLNATAEVTRLRSTIERLEGVVDQYQSLDDGGHLATTTLAELRNPDKNSGTKLIKRFQIDSGIPVKNFPESGICPIKKFGWLTSI